MSQFLRSFKWYRRRKGGEWWYVKNYDYFERTHLWMWSEDEIDFPEFDGLMMDDMGSFTEKNGDHYCYYGWKYMVLDAKEKYVCTNF